MHQHYSQLVLLYGLVWRTVDRDQDVNMNLIRTTQGVILGMNLC